MERGVASNDIEVCRVIEWSLNIEVCRVIEWSLNITNPAARAFRMFKRSGLT